MVTPGAERKAVAHLMEAHQELWINRWASSATVEIRKVSANIAKIDKPINGTQQVTLRDVIFE